MHYVAREFGWDPHPMTDSLTVLRPWPVYHIIGILQLLLLLLLLLPLLLTYISQ